MVAPVILIGDIHYNKSDKSGKIGYFILYFNMMQHVQVPTHIHGNTLDLALSSLDDNMSSSLIVYYVTLSDHYLVKMNLNSTKHKQPSKYPVKRCLRNIIIINNNIYLKSNIQCT